MYFKMDLGAIHLLGLDTTLAVILVLDCADSSLVFFFLCSYFVATSVYISETRTILLRVHQ